MAITRFHKPRDFTYFGVRRSCRGTPGWIARALMCALLVMARTTSLQAQSATGPAGPGSEATTKPAILSAAAVKGLSPEEIAASRTIRLRGAITYLANQPSILFLQDGTGGICVFGPREPTIRRALRPGVLIEVEGVVAGGQGGPYLTTRSREPLAITVLDESRAVEPAQSTVASLLALRSSGDLVEVQATCRSVRIESFGPNQDALIVSLADGGQRLELAYLNWNAATGNIPRNWVGAVLRVKGVFNSVIPDRQQIAAMRLLMSNIRDASIVRPATPADELPITPAAAVGTVPPDQARTRLQGVVTLAVAGKGMYVQDQSAGVWIDAPRSAPAPPRTGERVNVVGFPGRRDGAVQLEDAVWTSMGVAGLPPPPAVTAEQALSGDFNARHVQMDALVLEISRLAEGSTLVLQAGERVFLARLAGPADANQAVPAAENSWVRVAGVCVNNRAPVDVVTAATDVPTRPVSFHLMLAGPQAVSVIRAPNWWTLERVLVVIGVLLLAALAAIAWVIALRRRVTQQTAQIHRHIHQETLNEERMRIARELHDSLEQDLLGITMQLKATEKLLDRPDRARSSLQLASAMVRRSQAETHRAVWDLRERKVGQEGLVPTLRSALAGMTGGAGGAVSGGGPAIEVTVNGQERELPPQTENHLLRVALESVTNAFKHADASHVHVRVDFEPERVVLEVRDDGKGFDADHPPMPNSGHFGLFGMRERAAKLHGDLNITSRPGETRIHLVTPTNGKG